MLKLTFCLRRLPSLSLDEFQDYWLNKHAPANRLLLGAPAIAQAQRAPPPGRRLLGRRRQ